MIFITGSNGFLGRQLTNRLNGRKLSLLTRGAPKISSGHRFLQSEIDSLSDFTSGLKDCDTVIHCAARVHIMGKESSESLNAYREVNTVGTLNLAKQSVEAGVKRFIFISSIKVNGETTEPNKPFKYSDERSPSDSYGISKSEAEEQLMILAEKTGLEVVVIRPTLIYGPGVKANFASLMSLVSKGIPLPFGSITDNKRSLVSVNNLVDLVVTCIDHPKAANQVFLVSDDDDVSTSQIVHQMAKSLGNTELQLPIPRWCFRFFGKVLGKQDVVDRLLGSLQVDITHTKETLNWQPPQSLEDGFKETAQAFLQSRISNQ